MEKFILVNKKILDHGNYSRGYQTLKKLIFLDVKEYFTKLGFDKISSRNGKRYSASLRFYNAELDMEITLSINKKNRMRFVKMEKKFSFYGGKLQGILSIPETKKFPVVIVCHGYASSTESKTRTVLSEFLVGKGVACFGFDFTGCGSSRGELSDLTISRGLEDMGAAFNYVKNFESSDGKIGLVGSSFGGSVAILFAAENPVDVLALKSPASDYDGLKEIPIIEKPETFFQDAAQYDVYAAAEKINSPTLIVHGGRDADVPPEQSVKLFSRLKCEKKLKLIASADHRYSSEKDFSLLLREISQWILRKL